MKARRIFETVLYATDLAAAKRFYRDVLGLELHEESDLMLVFRLSDSVLLIFNPALSCEAGRSIPPHGAIGNGHVAFGATPEEIEQWKVRLESLRIEIEAVHQWESGAASLYIRDPEGNSVEFAPPTLWGGNWRFDSA